MTSLSRRKRRITARRITLATLAASAVALAVLAGPGAAQPAKTGVLPLPPGYRPRTPAPQPQPQPAQRSTSAGVPGSGGTVMYFQKPAEALTATGGPGSPAGVPDASAPPPASRYLSRDLPDPPAVTVSTQPDPLFPTQPGEEKKSTSQKKQPPPPVPEEYIQLPAREKIFMVYDDPQLERAVMERIIADRIQEIQKQIKEAKAKGQETKEMEKNLRDLQAIKNPLADPKFRFPALPVISPPGVAYQP